MKTQAIQTDNPGSASAIKRGCRCPAMDNGYGRGWMGSGTIFVVNETCPLHGKEATEKLKELRKETE